MRNIILIAIGIFGIVFATINNEFNNFGFIWKMIMYVFVNFCAIGCGFYFGRTYEIWCWSKNFQSDSGNKK